MVHVLGTLLFQIQLINSPYKQNGQKTDLKKQLSELYSRRQNFILIYIASSLTVAQTMGFPVKKETSI